MPKAKGYFANGLRQANSYKARPPKINPNPKDIAVAGDMALTDGSIR
jgi:hypothetical protein